MAKRKKAKKATRRRRRVGALAMSASSPLVMYGSMAAGFLMGDTINAQIDKITGTADAKIVGAAEAGIGAALVYMKLGKKKSVAEVAVGGILVGAGAKRLAKTFGLINGIGGYNRVPVVSGYGSVPVLGKASVNGYIPQSGSLNGAFNGYAVPKPAHTAIMGNSSGSGYNSGSGYMD